MTAGLGAALLHYPILLPTDYPMHVIRDRVRVRGHALDDREGLAFKAYCITEVGVDEAVVNQYAPFYYWHSIAAAGDFFWGGAGFAGIVSDFGRPSVLSWLPAAAAQGSTTAGQVNRADLITRRIPAAADLVRVAADLTERVSIRAATPGVHYAVAGIEPTRWETVEFTTVSGVARTETGATRFAVLHVSQPS